MAVRSRNNKFGSILRSAGFKVILGIVVVSLVIGIIVYYGGEEEETKTPDTPAQPLPVPNQPPAAPPGGQPPPQPPAQAPAAPPINLFTPTSIAGLTGWYNSKLSSDGSKWIDNSGKGNDFVVNPGVTNKFTLDSNGVVSTDYSLPADNKDGISFSFLRPRNLIPSGEFTVFHVSRYKPGSPNNRIFDLSINADTSGNMTTLPNNPAAGYIGYRQPFGFYAGLQQCTIINNNYSPILEVGSSCYIGETQYPTSGNKFVQITSGYLLHRVNSEKREFVSRSPQFKTDAEAIAAIKPPTPLQVASDNSYINLVAPFESKEILIYNRNLTSTEINAVETYLNSKYAVY